MVSQITIYLQKESGKFALQIISQKFDIACVYEYKLLF